MQHDPSLDAISVDSLKSWLIDWMMREMELDRSSIDPAESFLSYGMDSIQSMTMVGDLEATFELQLAPTLAWDYPDVNTLASYLAERLRPACAAGGLASQPRTAIAEKENLLDKLDPLIERDVDGAIPVYVGTAK
jgi:acyl carrier protein